MQGLDGTPLIEKKEYTVIFSEQQKNFFQSLHYNGMNSYLFVNGVKIYKLKAKDSEMNAAPLFLSNVSKDFSADILYYE